MGNHFNGTLSTAVTTTGVHARSDTSGMVALEMIPIQWINRIVCCSLGIPLNVFVPVVIARSRQLWSPRNIHWLGVTFINFAMILQLLAELITNKLYQRKDGSHRLLCEIHSTLLGCPFGLLLTSLTLASLDRYLALSRPQFYQNRVTIKSSITVSVMAFLLVAGFHTSSYWTGYYTPKCTIRYNWQAITMFYQAILSIVLVALQSCLFVFLRNSSLDSLPMENIEMEQMNGQQSMTSTAEESKGGSIKNQWINRMDLRSARILNSAILPFSIVTLTSIVSSFVLFILKSQEMDDSVAGTVMVTSHELLLINLIYIPSVFISQSREFHLALGRFYRTKVSQSVDNFI